jgi:DNA-binding LacI/PurR family transcriptional regulator
MTEADPAGAAPRRRRPAAGTGAARRRPTQADVAVRARVSAAIVSAVVNGREHGTIRISTATRERVWQAVRDLGYVPNIAARNLAHGRNRLVGVFTFQSLFPLSSRDFYYEFLVGIEEAAEQAGYNLLMFTGAKDRHGDRSIYPDGINCLQLADGAILLGVNESGDEVARLVAEGYPFVFVGHRQVPGVEVSYTAADYRGGTEMIVGELLARGRRRIAMVQNADVHEGIPGRRAGFRRARRRYRMTEQDLPVIGYDPATDSPETVIERARRQHVDALVVEVSAVAPALRTAARRAGLRVPDDLALVGLSGSPELPGMATVAEMTIPRREMGQQAVSLLLRLLDEPASAPLRTTLRCGLREGRTLSPRRD